jgi:hypothetical protein
MNRQFFASSFRSFAMASSAKQLVAATVFAAMLFSGQSLRAGIVYSNTTSDGTRSVGNNTGNTFTTTSSASTLDSISLYLRKDTETVYNGGGGDYGGGEYGGDGSYEVTATGFMRIDLYRATDTGPGPYNWDPSFGHLADSAEINVDTMTSSPSLYTFTFSNTSLLANTRYSFMTGFRDGSNGQLIHVYTKSSTTSGSPTIGTQNLIIDGVGYNESIRGTIVTTDSAAVPEIDPATGVSALSLVAGVLAMIEQRRRRATLVA